MGLKDLADAALAKAFWGIDNSGPRHVQITTPSGRTFRYELSEFPFGPSVTPEQALAIARRIFREKYRYCEWDQKHPQVDVLQEIVTQIVAFILETAETMKKVQARKPRVFASWGIFAGKDLIQEFPYPQRAEAEQRLQVLQALNPGDYELQQIRRTKKQGGHG